MSIDPCHVIKLTNSSFACCKQAKIVSFSSRTPASALQFYDSFHSPFSKSSLICSFFPSFFFLPSIQFSQSTFICPQVSNGPLTGSRKRPSEGNYEKEKDVCIQLFDQWSEADQVEFVEHLISRMCHYQHGHINSYLKPMLQRDFITALPGNA